jgi:hypothetical protein
MCQAQVKPTWQQFNSSAAQQQAYLVRFCVTRIATRGGDSLSNIYDRISLQNWDMEFTLLTDLKKEEEKERK